MKQNNDEIICNANYNYNSGKIVTKGDELSWYSRFGGTDVPYQKLKNLTFYDALPKMGIILAVGFGPFIAISGMIYALLFEYNQSIEIWIYMGCAIIVIGLYMYIYQYKLEVGFNGETGMIFSGKELEMLQLRTYLEYRYKRLLDPTHKIEFEDLLSEIQK